MENWASAYGGYYAKRERGREGERERWVKVKAKLSFLIA
jgi:hypothetical protein